MDRTFLRTTGGHNRNEDNDESSVNVQQYEDEQLVPMEEEIILSEMYSIKNNNASGDDGMVAELFKYGGRELGLRIVKLIQDVWIKEEIPDD
ncbi:hypothetical protein ANN_17685 [Periplaneta americana]|uniref:Uncharacterized protein n=1 Tax=Periplaneta americana TaxID=6978 RepID=A0ABQ8SUY0_PERAM|nr:hypothetical protein ANN_17685 [Periplaneta americana]